MSSPKRLALLVCDTPPSIVREAFGNYTAIYNEWLQLSLPAPHSYDLDSYDVVGKMEYPPEDSIDSYDGIILTGSAASAYENLEWIDKLVEYTAHIAKEKPRIKIIGICFGHQIVGRAFGSDCVRNDGRWELGPTPIELTELGKKLFGVESLNIHQMHRDHVPVIPSGFQLIGSTPVSNNQGMVRFSSYTNPDEHDLDKIHILTLQGHPEYIEGIVTRLITLRAEKGIIDAETAADAERRRYWRHDGIDLGKAVWGVLGVTAREQN